MHSKYYLLLLFGLMMSCLGLATEEDIVLEKNGDSINMLYDFYNSTNDLVVSYMKEGSIDHIIKVFNLPIVDSTQFYLFKKGSILTPISLSKNWFIYHEHGDTGIEYFAYDIKNNNTKSIEGVSIVCAVDNKALVENYSMKGILDLNTKRIDTLEISKNLFDKIKIDPYAKEIYAFNREENTLLKVDLKRAKVDSLTKIDEKYAMRDYDVVNEQLIVLTQDDQLLLVDQDGHNIWQLESNVKVKEFKVKENHIYALSTRREHSQSIMSIELKSGKIKHIYKENGYVKNIHLYKNRLYTIVLNGDEHEVKVFDNQDLSIGIHHEINGMEGVYYWHQNGLVFKYRDEEIKESVRYRMFEN